MKNFFRFLSQSEVRSLLSIFILGAMLLSSCQGQAGNNITPTPGAPKVLAVESFLADITQNVVGDRAKVDTLIPAGVDPHEYQPTPQDAARIENSTVLVVNGAGLEAWLDKTLQNVGGQRTVIDATLGLIPLSPVTHRPVLQPGEPGDPHLWMDPLQTVHYVENIRDGLINADPAGADVYKKNADAYIAQIKQLDTWIQGQVQQIPPARRLLVTDHEDLGYYADRYGLKVVGTVIPGISTEASPSAQQIGQLISAIRSTGAPAIFIENGANTQVAQQVAQEAGVKLVTGLYTHSVSAPNGPAPTYLAMMKYDTELIVNALK